MAKLMSRKALFLGLAIAAAAALLFYITFGPKHTVSIVFPGKETNLSADNESELWRFAKFHNKEGDYTRIAIIAYASGTTDQATAARRISLSRALSVRAYLIDQGVINLRINVQAEGINNTHGNPDRADIFIREE